MTIKKNGHVTTAIKKQQKLQRLIDEFSGLRELEELGLGVKSKAEELVQRLEDAGVLEKPNGTGNKDEDKVWNDATKNWVNHARPTQWFQEAENNGLLDGKGQCAKRLKQLAKRDQRKLKKATESRKNVREQLGDDLWKQGLAGLAPVGKPRGVKKPAPASEEGVA